MVKGRICGSILISRNITLYNVDKVYNAYNTYSSIQTYHLYTDTSPSNLNKEVSKRLKLVFSFPSFSKGKLKSTLQLIISSFMLLLCSFFTTIVVMVLFFQSFFIPHLFLLYRVKFLSRNTRNLKL